MLGCFNITLYAYFDIHRIFDLILFRLWDFIVWWFDLDFILFDFNFDFILCLSFLFIFLIHFFIKLIFSFLNNFIIFNTIIKKLNFIYIYYNWIGFITFLFINVLLYLMNALETYFIILLICFSDFSSFSDSYINYIHNQTFLNYNTYFYILFYFVIIIINTYWLLILRFFFSQSFYNLISTDVHLTNKLIDINYINLIKLFIILNNYINTSQLISYYSFIHILYINVIISFLLLTIFYTYKIFCFNVITLSFKHLILKKINTLYNLNSCYTLDFYKHMFSNITFLFLLNYIIFIINFFGLFIKDFIYINIIINMFNIFLIFSYFYVNFNFSIKNIFKKQLIYLMF